MPDNIYDAIISLATDIKNGAEVDMVKWCDYIIRYAEQARGNNHADAIMKIIVKCRNPDVEPFLSEHDRVEFYKFRNVIYSIATSAVEITQNESVGDGTRQGGSDGNG